MESVNAKNDANADPIKVLVADDDPPTRMLLRAAISKWGYEVVEASDGEEAFNVLKEENPAELVILDWIMPKLDGPSLCIRIKKELTSTPYVILLTQVSGTTNIIKGLEAGADEFLSKPFNMAELRSRLSVGARIVDYKHQLEKQNKKITDYIDKAEKIISQVTDTSQKMTDYLKTQDNTTESEWINKITFLQNDLKQLTENFRKNNLSKHEDK